MTLFIATLCIRGIQKGHTSKRINHLGSVWIKFKIAVSQVHEFFAARFKLLYDLTDDI